VPRQSARCNAARQRRRTRCRSRSAPRHSHGALDIAPHRPHTRVSSAAAGKRDEAIGVSRRRHRGGRPQSARHRRWGSRLPTYRRPTCGRLRAAGPCSLRLPAKCCGRHERCTSLYCAARAASEGLPGRTPAAHPLVQSEEPVP